MRLMQQNHVLRASLSYIGSLHKNKPTNDQQSNKGKEETEKIVQQIEIKYENDRKSNFKANLSYIETLSQINNKNCKTYMIRNIVQQMEIMSMLEIGQTY